MSCCSVKVSRARPLLGTRVEIIVHGAQPTILHEAADAAFEAIARVHGLMSFQRPDSDVARLNREAWRRPVQVDAHTWHVLERALALSEGLDGIFDITATVSSAAAEALNSKRPPCFRDVELMSGHRVRFGRALTVDLGGIAKGHAVDRAVDCLQNLGIGAGVVNAGGDLRVFGEDAVAVEVRDPRRPACAAAVAQIRNAGFATTACYGRQWGESAAGHVVDPRRPNRSTSVRSASVRAPSCLVADALAKSLYLCGANATAALARYGASGFLLDGDGMLRVA